jgi:deoxyribonuclease (pyrimidine dimer)
MTRINSGIDPKTLCDQHLLAEYREMPRIASLAWHRWKTYQPIPPLPKFTLGKGHMLFFVDKGLYLEKRFASIVDELTKRGYAISFRQYRAHPEPWHKDHLPTTEEVKTVLNRISERMPKVVRKTFY